MSSALISAFECSICCEYYNATSNVPTAFPCGHSCCIKHIEAMALCHVCRTKLPDNLCPSVTLRDGAMELSEIIAMLSAMKAAPPAPAPVLQQAVIPEEVPAAPPAPPAAVIEEEEDPIPHSIPAVSPDVPPDPPAAPAVNTQLTSQLKSMLLGLGSSSKAAQPAVPVNPHPHPISPPVPAVRPPAPPMPLPLPAPPRARPAKVLARPLQPTPAPAAVKPVRILQRSQPPPSSSPAVRSTISFSSSEHFRSLDRLPPTCRIAHSYFFIGQVCSLVERGYSAEVRQIGGKVCKLQCNFLISVEDIRFGQTVCVLGAYASASTVMVVDRDALTVIPADLNGIAEMNELEVARAGQGCWGSNCSCSSHPLSCPGCQVVSYCCLRCQREDWNEHKRHCQAFPAFIKVLSIARGGS